ncbi:MAG: hypothetical protein Q9169_007056 [Polycauliona sp. 2 TL-2023]
MATPNTSHHKPAPTPRPPTSASVMTPASFSASSPAAPPSTHSTGAGHRSRQSPAHFSSSSSSTTKAGKSPFNHLQQSHHLLASVAGGQPMSRSGTNTSSPGAMPNMAAFAGLNGMLMNAVDGGNFKTGLTPAGGIGTPGGDGVSPMPSQLGAGDGVGTSVNGSMVRQQVRDQQEERRLRLENIVRLLGERWGFVSREGVERCARRVGLECLWEDELPGADGRTLSIAGNSVLVDVTFVGRGDEVGSVTLAFPGREEGEWGRNAKEGAEVLQKDLKGEYEDNMNNVGLEPFVQNLQRLGTLDRLGAGDVNCFDAVDGIGGALRKIWEMEMTKRKESKNGEVQEGIDIDVMCKDSGKPTMHAGGRLGLALQYWTDRRYLASRKRKADEMDLDDDDGQPPKAKKPSTWSATIECQPSSADLYTSIRVSSKWIGEVTEKPTADQEDPFSNSNNESSNINWQDPPSTFMNVEPPTSGAMDLSADTMLQPKPPDVRFIARFHPPVLVPLQTAINIFNAVGVQEAMHATTYESLLLPNKDGTPSTSCTERVVERDIYRPIHNDGGEDVVGSRHRYTLFTDSQAYARNIEEIPFAHPRQIVALLPVLRQWAFVSCILRRCFPPSTLGDKQEDPFNRNTGSNISDSESDSDSDADSDSTSNTDSNTSLHPKSSSTIKKPPQHKPIDVSLSLSGSSPRIDIIFPYKHVLATISFSIEANAEISDVDIQLGTTNTADRVNGDNGQGEEDEKRRKRRREGVKRVLELSEDLGVVIEWVGGG